MKLFFTSQASKHFAHDKSKFITPELERVIANHEPDFIIPQAEDRIPKVICEYSSGCKAKANGRTNCMSAEGQRNCASYKFYERYKKFEYGRYLGI